MALWRLSGWIQAVGWLLLCGCASVSAESPPVGFDKLKLDFVVSKTPVGNRPPLLIHFHGAKATVAENFHRINRRGALVVVNCQGLSSAYRRPFENPGLFAHVLAHARRRLIETELVPADATWGTVDISCFSAGYGAVREILKDANAVARIRGLVAADAIYASIHLGANRRAVDARQMQPFLAFAKQAEKERKTFVLSHSQLPVVEYASTVETSDYLLEAMGLKRRASVRKVGRPVETPTFRPESETQCGRFLVLGFPGDDGPAHLQHLRHISQLWARLHEVEQSDSAADGHKKLR